MEELGPNSDVVTCMVFHGDAYLVAALKNGHIAIWNHLRSTLSRKIENSTLVTSLLSFQKKYVQGTLEANNDVRRGYVQWECFD